jgi:cbb3-type cytochrome oxidase maturation protein
MGIVPLLVIAALALSAVGLGLFMWAVKGGQFEELEAEAVRALRDGPPLPDHDSDQKVP